MKTNKSPADGKQCSLPKEVMCVVAAVLLYLKLLVAVVLFFLPALLN